MPSDAEKRIQELHLTLPPAPKPVAVYKTAVKLGNLLYVSGHGPVKVDRSMISGRLGQDMNLDQGKDAARQVGLAILATVKDTLGSLNKVIVATLSVPPPMPIMLENTPMAAGMTGMRGPRGTSFAITVPSSGNSILTAITSAITAKTADRTRLCTCDAMAVPASAPSSTKIAQRRTSATSTDCRR